MVTLSVNFIAGSAIAALLPRSRERQQVDSASTAEFGIRRLALSLIVLASLFFCGSAKAESQSTEPAPSVQGSNGVVQLPPFVVEAASAPARLRIDFRHHMLWARLRSLTFTDVPVTAPTPGLTISPGDPVTVQLNVVDWPAETVAGVALKPVMVGGFPTTTEAVAVADPNEFVAVSV